MQFLLISIYRTNRLSYFSEISRPYIFRILFAGKYLQHFKNLLIVLIACNVAKLSLSSEYLIVITRNSSFYFQTLIHFRFCFKQRITNEFQLLVACQWYTLNKLFSFVANWQTLPLMIFLSFYVSGNAYQNQFDVNQWWCI